MTSGIASKGTDLDSIFAPYVSGTTKARTSGIDSFGTDLSTKYANIIYGSAAAATGINSKGDDLNALYAKLGSTSYALGCDGYEYFSQTSAHSTTYFFFDSASTWAITGNVTSTTPSGGPVSGDLSANATQFYLTVTKSGTTSAITTATTGSWQSITSGLSVISIDLASATNADATCIIELKLRDAAGNVLSTTDFSMDCHTTGP